MSLFAPLSAPMLDQEISRMAALESSYWWYSALHEFVLRRIRHSLSPESTVLDLGCGSGYLLKQIKNTFQCTVFGADTSATAIAQANAKGISATQQDMRSALQSFSDESLDIILLLDSLYFLDEDQQRLLVAAAVKKLRRRGRLIIHVPAGSIFKREHDQTVGIRRRYHRKDLRGLTSNLDGHIYLRARVCFLSLGILMRKATQKLIPSPLDRSDLLKLPSALNFILKKIQRWEDLSVAPPFGSSLYLEIQRG